MSESCYCRKYSKRCNDCQLTEAETQLARVRALLDSEPWDATFLASEIRAALDGGDQ